MGGPVRYGVLGTGLMGLEHLLNLRLIDEAQVVALCDPHEPSQSRARSLAPPDVAVFDDPRAFLERAPIDALVIASPNHTHAELLHEVFAARSDLHVLVEKPLCTSVEDCRRVAEAAERHGGVVQVGMEYRYMPPIARLLARLAEGEGGRLRMCAIREHRYPFLPKVGDWNRFSRNTGGTLVEKCCHFFDLMNVILRARPVRVYASGAMDVNHLDERYGGEKPDILDNAYAVVDFDGGARALLDLCMFAEGTRNEQEICVVGDTGKLECFVPEGTVVTGRRSPREVTSEHVPVEERLLAAGFHQGSTYYEHRAFLRSIRTGAPPEVSLADGLLAVAMGQAGEISAREGRPVALAELGVA